MGKRKVAWVRAHCNRKRLSILVAELPLSRLASFIWTQDLEDAVFWLTSQGQTMWTEPLLQVTLSNAAAGLTVQTGGPFGCCKGGQ